MAIAAVPAQLMTIQASKTYSAAWFSGSTKEAQIQAAINAAVVDGAVFVWVPQSMLPYNASLVTFNSSVLMLREGGNDRVDLSAYGASTGNNADAALAAALAYLTATGITGPNTLYSPAGNFSFANAYTITTPIVIVGEGIPNTTWTYTGSATFLTWNFGTAGGVHRAGPGLQRIYLVGPGSGTTSVACLLGGTSGAEGFYAVNARIDTFGTGLSFWSNTYLTQIDHCVLIANGTHVLGQVGGSNSGENCVFTACTFANSNPLGADINMPGSCQSQFRFMACSFDNAQVSVASGTALFVGCHFENPGSPGNAEFIIQTGGDIQLVYPLFRMNDTRTIAQFVKVTGGTLSAVGTRAEAQTAGMPQVYLADTGSVVTLYGTIHLFNILHEFSCTGFHGPLYAASWGAFDIFTGNAFGNTNVVSATQGDASTSWTHGASAPVINFATALTAIRTYTLNHTGTCAGAEVLVKRTGGGQFALTVQDQTPTTLALLAPNQWVRCVFNGVTNVWEVVSRGSLGPATSDTQVALTAAASVALDASLGNYFTINITSNIAVTVAVPTNAPPQSGSSASQEIVVAYRNTSGGALTTPPTFAGTTGGFKFAAVTNPANGTQVLYKFRWDAPTFFWVEVGTHLAAGL